MKEDKNLEDHVALILMSENGKFIKCPIFEKCVVTWYISSS